MAEEPNRLLFRKGWKCLRCGHNWIPKLIKRPITCPKCKSIKWDEERQ